MSATDRKLTEFNTVWLQDTFWSCTQGLGHKVMKWDRRFKIFTGVQKKRKLGFSLNPSIYVTDFRILNLRFSFGGWGVIAERGTKDPRKTLCPLSMSMNNPNTKSQVVFLCRIWYRFAVSISNDDNRYTS